ncbi:MAG: ATP-binding protein [Clostridia bacterium]|nr:ATP-binding protein [Clostridia bacterium]
MWLIVLVGCIFVALGIIIGYLLGNTSLKKFFYKELEESEHQGAIQKSITENVGIGILVYAESDPIYINQAIKDMRAFIGNGIPKSFEVFLDTYDKDNHLKSDYLLSIENGVDVIRTTYVAETRVFEMKIIQREVEYAGKEKNEDAPTIERLHIILVEDITQIKDDERRQKELAANVSHELRTPLTVIRGSEDFVDKLNAGEIQSIDEIKRWANRILSNAVRMQDIVEDFLTLSNKGELKKMGTFDPYSIVMKSIGNLNDYPPAKNVKIIPPKEDAYPLGFGNGKLIVRIITNLLTNAVKYIEYDDKTVPNEVKVNIVTTGDRIGIQVEDNGRGIPKNDLNHLFERFYRVDNSGSREVGGSGLGLAIAKELTDVHDGTINVTSVLNSGSTFTLFLPKAEAVFNRVYEDAKAGVTPENEYYNVVFRFLVAEGMEYAKSRRVQAIADHLEKIEVTEIDRISDSDKIKILTLLGDEHFANLVDELTYVFVDDYEDEEDDGEYEDETMVMVEPIVSSEEAKFEAEAVEFAAEVLEQEAERQRILEEEARIEQEKRELEELERQKKKEAQELLRQPVVQQSVKQNITPPIQKAPIEPKNQETLTPKADSGKKADEFSTLEQKEVIHIHPNGEKKMYNSTGVKLFDKKQKGKKKSTTSTSKPSEKAEPIRSAVKQVLDEAGAIDSKANKEQ